MHRLQLGFWLTLVWVLSCSFAAAELPKPAHPQWKPIADDVYLQEVGRRLETKPLSAVAVYHDQIYLGYRDGLGLLKDDKADGLTLEPLKDGPRADVSRLKVMAGALWALAADGLWKFDGRSWSKLTNQAVADVCLHDGRLIVAGAGLSALDGDSLKPLLSSKDRLAPKDDLPLPKLRGVASYAGAIYVHDGRQVWVLDGKHLNIDDVADWGKLPPGATIRDMLTVGNRLILATDKGLAVLRGMTWYAIQGADGLCYEDSVCLAPGFADDLWIGTMCGGIRNVDDQYQYFGYQRWLPHNKVNAIACGDQGVYLATDGGLGIIQYEPYTLAKKAAWYEQWLNQWGQKRLGFIHGLVRRDGQWVRHVSDNDVGYSAHYLSALCFRYAVTGDQAARAEAVDMMKSVKWSEEIPSLEGYPARSVWAVGETADKAMHGSGGYPAEWHPTPDGRWEWKGDTSSDELVAQVYEIMIFLELVANQQERKWATEHLDRIIGHIVREGWVLRDVDGKPTRWGRWDPEFLHAPEAANELGLNSLQALGFTTAAGHFTGDGKFQAAKAQLIAWGYPSFVLRQKISFPTSAFTHFDDRLALLAYFPLMIYETDPALKGLWLRSLERTWEIKRIEGDPWANYIYGALTGSDCENARAVAHLRQWPLDLRVYSYANSMRHDLHTPKGYRVYAERIRPFSPRETAPGRWDRDFMEMDSSGDGRSVADPGGWLEVYWMGRYYGLITEPTVRDERLLTVPKSGLQLGAEPYHGPPRPKLRHES